MALPLVAIIGRPNVGKSSLFNRITGGRTAIVAEAPGTTRDRVVARAEWHDRPFLLVDTGGLEPDTEDPLLAQVKRQAEMAVEEADVIVFVTDTLAGVAPADRDIANWLRRANRPVVLAVNKADNEAREYNAAEFYELGLGDPLAISAYHNLGIYDLLDRIVEKLPPPGEGETAEEKPAFAIVGRPNVGKSSILNAVLGEERAIVSPIPGTTRDVLDTPFEYGGKQGVLVDTAGIRRRGRVEQGVEHYSVLRAIRALERADVVLMVIDGGEGPTAQDGHVLGMAFELHKGIVLVVNKWDLAAGKGIEREVVVRHLREMFHFMPYAPVVFTSAVERTGLKELMDVAFAVYEEQTRWVPVRALEREVLKALGSHPPPVYQGRPISVERVLQGGIKPPTFVFIVDHPEVIHFSYQRYLENWLRNVFNYAHSHLRLVFRKPREGDQL